MRYEGDRWWVATLLLFGPRWLWALPLVPLLPLAVFGRPRSLATLLIAALLLLFPVMNLRLPWRRLTADPSTGPTLRLLTLNTHEGVLNAAALRELIAATDPQIVLLQELDLRLGRTVFADGPWNTIVEGELCIASRYPLRRVGPIGTPKTGWSYAATMYEVATPAGPVPMVNVHLSSPHVAFRNTLHRDPHGWEQIQKNSEIRTREAYDIARAAADAGPAVLVAGDFNLPTESPAYRSNLGSFANAFDVAGFGFGSTYDVKLTVARIDHILSGSGWICRRCWVGPDLGSPHRPLMADVEWTGGAMPPVAVPVVDAPAPPVVGGMRGPVTPAPRPVLRAAPPALVAPTTEAGPIAEAIRKHQLAVGMTIEQATEALAGWEGPVEVRAKLDEGSKLLRWRKGEERIGAAFDAAGKLRSFQKL